MLPDWLIVICLPLAVWRLSIMLVNEAGPFAMLETLRFWLGAGKHSCEQQRGSVTNVLCCINCTSVWVAALLLILMQHVAGQAVVAVLGLSAISIMIERVKW